MADGRESLRISAESGDLDVAAVHDFLARESYRAAGIPAP